MAISIKCFTDKRARKNELWKVFVMCSSIRV